MPKPRLMDHVILLIGVAVMLGPLAVLIGQLFVGVSWAAYREMFTYLWTQGVNSAGPPARLMLINSLILALGLALVKGTASLLAAYALLYLRPPGGRLLYGAILLTMFFPIETRILPTFLVASHIGLLNSYGGMILPVAASGLGVLVFSQYLRQIPPEVIEAARIDGAGPLRLFRDIILPLSVPMICALFAILFVLGWNQYVWPIMINTTNQTHGTLVSGMASAGLGGSAGKTLALLALVPPGIVVLILQRWLVRGLTQGIH